MEVKLDAIYTHKRTGVLYKTILKSFDVQTQKPHIIYMGLNTGQVFNRDEQVFKENFEIMKRNIQSTIKPKDK